jgi:hypothetical protein
VLLRGVGLLLRVPGVPARTEHALNRMGGTALLGRKVISRAVPGELLRLVEVPPLLHPPPLLAQRAQLVRVLHPAGPARPPAVGFVDSLIFVVSEPVELLERRIPPAPLPAERRLQHAACDMRDVAYQSRLACCVVCFILIGRVLCRLAVSVSCAFVCLLGDCGETGVAFASKNE